MSLLLGKHNPWEQGVGRGGVQQGRKWDFDPVFGCHTSGPTACVPNTQHTLSEVPAFFQTLPSCYLSVCLSVRPPMHQSSAMCHLSGSSFPLDNKCQGGVGTGRKAVGCTLA